MLLRHLSPRELFDENASGTGGAAPTPASPAAPTSTTPDAGSGSPDPSPTPASPEPGAPAPATAFSLPEFGEDDDNDDVVVLPPGGPAAPVEPAAPAPQAPAAPVAPQPTPQAPTPEPAAPVAPQPAAGAPSPDDATPPLDRTNPAEVASFLAQNRDASIAAIAATYQLSQQEVEALETNAVEVIPSLLARVQFNATVAALNRMSEMVPAMIQRHTQASNRNTENATAFFSANPHLDRSDPNVMAKVSEMARVYRQTNPQASKAEMISAVGLLVSHALGKMPTAAQPSLPGVPVARSPVPTGFVPSGGGAAPVPSAPVAEPWSGMGSDFD